MESFEDWLAFGGNLVETGPVQPPDLRARHAKDLAQDPVARFRCMFRRRHQLPKLELDQVVDLLLRERFHVNTYKNL